MAAAAIAGAAAMVVASTLSGGVAGALTEPAAGPPSFNQAQASESIRGSGSDTTVFMMQKIGDLYTAAGLYGCNLDSSAGQTTAFGGPTATAGPPSNLFQYCQPSSADSVTTDDSDNWNRVEVEEGINDVGSGAGQGQLCGSTNDPIGLQVDFARSSKPASTTLSCSNVLQELGYAKDAVPMVTFPGINPSVFGTSSFSSAQLASTAYPHAAYNTINGGVVGPVAAGWLPADNPTGTLHGTKPVNISNVSIGGAKDTSAATRLFCDNHLTNTSGATSAITDWGQMTNLGPNVELYIDTTAGQPGVTVDAESGGAVPNTIVGGDTVTDSYDAAANTPFTGGSTTVLSTGPGNLITMNANAQTTGTYIVTFNTTVANTTYTGSTGTLPTTLPIGSVTGWPSTVGTGTIAVNAASLPAETPALSSIQPFQYTGISGSSLTGVSYPTLASYQPGGITVTANNGATVAKPQFGQGYGSPVGIPLRIMDVNPASGTVATFAGYAEGTSPADTSTSSGNYCSSSTTETGVNGANDPNASTIPATGPYSTNPAGSPANLERFALENNAHQYDLFSGSDFPGDYASQAIEEATTLYFMSNGVFNTNTYAGQTTINGTPFSAFEVAENGVSTGTVADENNIYPTARTLSNIIRTDTVRQSTAGFMNWICDADIDITKGQDNNTGFSGGYDAELGNLISTQFGFPRLSDISTFAAPTPADNIIAPNSDCVAQIPITVTGGVITETSGGNFPIDLINGGSVLSLTGTALPGGETLTSAGGGANITLSTTPADGTYTAAFVGVPSVVGASSTP
jgi:hypothetical protein